MELPLQIEFHNTHPIEAVESRIRQELAEFEKFYHRLVSCRVDVEAPKHEHRGGVSRVRIDLSLAAKDVAAWAELRVLEAGESPGHVEVSAEGKDPSMAVHAAFNIAHRRLEEFAGGPNRHP